MHGWSLAGKRAFYGPERHACACSKDDCAAFRGDRFASAPCLGAPSRTTCRVLGGSHMTMGAESEVLQWQDLVNGTDTLIVLQTRSNLVKWAWSFYRTGAMKRLRREPVSASKESIHRREGVEDDRSRSTRMHVDPIALLRMIVAKQARSERLLKTARRLARLTTNRREYVLLYETMQDNLEGEMERLYTSLRVPFDAKAHRRVPPGLHPSLSTHQRIFRWSYLIGNRSSKHLHRIHVSKKCWSTRKGTSSMTVAVAMAGDHQTAALTHVHLAVALGELQSWT